MSRVQIGLLVGGVLVVLGLAGLAVTFFGNEPVEVAPVPQPEVVEEVVIVSNPQLIGTSVEGRSIESYVFGSGSTTLLFVGGIHGGYEWNSSLLAYEMIDHLEADESLVPGNISVHIIPALNPDGLALVTGKDGKFVVEDVAVPSVRNGNARFNANAVDLNRNFACNWAPTSTWRGAEVSAGTAAFSEPEAAALRDYVLAVQPTAVAFWHSQANNVYGSFCNEGVLAQTSLLGARYATAGSYGFVEKFDAYPITGDAEGWLATLGIPAVTVETESFSSIEWSRNWAGVQSWLSYYNSGE